MRKRAKLQHSLSGRALAVVLILLYLLLTLIVALFSIRKLLPTPEEILALVKSQLEFNTGAKVHISKVSGSALKSINLHELRIGDDKLSPTGAVLSCERVEVKLNPLALLNRGRMQDELIRQIKLHSPTLHLHRDASGVWNFQRAFKPRRPARPPMLTIRIVAVNGRLIYEDEMMRLSSGKALRLKLHQVRAKLAFYPSRRHTPISCQTNRLTWELTGIGDSHIVRRVSTTGAVSQGGAIQAQLKVVAHNVTPEETPARLAKAMQRHIEWLGGRASVRLTADVRRDEHDARPSVTLKSAFEVRQPSFVIKSVTKKPISVVSLSASASATLREGRLVKGGIVGHAVGGKGQFEGAHFELSHHRAQLHSRITLFGASTNWLQGRFGRALIPQGLDVISGRIERADISLRRIVGKPTSVDAHIIASNLAISSSSLKHPLRSPRLNLQFRLLASREATTGHAMFKALIAPVDGAPPASVAARINLWTNLINGDVTVTNMSAKALNMLQEQLLPFSGKLVGGLFNCSFSFRMVRGERKGWLDSRIELSDVEVRQLKVKGLPQWDRLFPDGANFERICGSARYSNGMWQIIGIGLSHRDFDAAVEGAISESPPAFRLAAKLFRVDFASVWGAIKRLLPKDSPYREIDLDAVAKGQLNLRMLGTRKMLVGGIEIDAPTMHLSKEGLGRTSIMPARSSIQLAYTHDEPPRTMAHINSHELTIRDANFGRDARTDIERLDVSSPIELLGVARLSKVTLQLGDGIRAHSSVNAKLVRIGKLMLQDVRFEMDACDGRIELSEIEGKLNGGAVRSGEATIEHIDGKELKCADFACAVERVRLAHVLGSLGSEMLPPSMWIDGVGSGKLSISLNTERVKLTYIGRVETPMLTYEAANEAIKPPEANGMAISSLSASGNAAQLQACLEFARAKGMRDSHKLSEGTLAASVDRGRTHIALSDGRFIDAPVRDVFVRTKFDYASVDVTDVQCVAWDAKLRGWMKWDWHKDELHMQALFSELNLSELEGLFKESLSGRSDGHVTFVRGRSNQQLTARLSACNLLLSIKAGNATEQKGNGHGETEFVRLPYISASIAWDGKALDVKSAKVHYADTEFSVSGEVKGLSEGLKKAEMNLTASAKAADIGRVLSELGVEADLEGVGSIDASITGTIAAPKVKAFVNVPLPLIAGVAFERLEGSITYDAASKAIVASPLRLKLAGGEVTATARADDIFNSQRLSGKVAARKLQLVWLLRQLAPKARIDGVVNTAVGTISGTLTNPSLELDFRIADARLHGTGIGNGNGRATFTRLGREAHSVKAQLVMKPQDGSMKLDLSLTRLKKKLSMNVRCDGDGLSLTWIEALLNSLDASLKAMNNKVSAIEQAIGTASKLPHPLSGTVKFTASYIGDDKVQRWRIDCAIPKLHMGRAGPYGLWAKLHGDDSQRHIEELRIVHADATAVCSGTVDKDGSMKLKADFQRLPLSVLSHFPRLRLPVDATVTASVLIHGSPDEPKLDITGEATDIRYRDLRIDGARFKSVKYEGNKLLAGRGDLVIHQAGHSMLLWGELPLKLGGRAPKDELDVHAQLLGAPITLWRSLLVPVDEKSVGHFNIDLHLGGTWELPTLYGKFDMSSPTVSLMDGKITLSDVSVSTVAEGRRVRIEQCSANWNGGRVSVEGYIELGKDALSSPMANNAAFDIRASDVPLAFGKLISLGKLNVAGRLQISSNGNGPLLQLMSASLSDQPQALRADGFAQWHAGLWDSWDSLKPSKLKDRLMLAECNFNLLLNKLRLRLRDAFDGYVSGKLHLANQEPSPGEPSLDRLVAVDGKLKRYMPVGIPTLTGTLTVHNGVMRGIPRFEARPALKPLKLALPKIEVTVRLGSDVELRNVQISAPLRGQVSVNGYPSRLNVVGRLYADRGVLRLPGGVLRLVVADIQVNAVSGSEVGAVQSFTSLNVEARGRVGNYEVTMHASGPLGGADGTKWAAVRFASTPPLDEGEIAKRLLGISSPKELVSESAYEALIETVTPTLQRAFVSTIGGGLAEAFGLEQITVEQEGGSMQRLGIGARISPNLYIRWYHGLAGQGNAIEVEQWLNKWVSFVWRQDERQRSEFRVQLHFQF